MRVLYLTQYYPPTIGAGSVRSHAMVHTWAKRGWDIDVLTEYPVYPLGKHIASEKIDKSDQQTPENVTVVRLDSKEYDPGSFSEKLRNQLGFLWNVLRYVMEHPERYDLIYVSSPPIFPAYAGIILKQLLDAQLTVELRDVWPDAIVPHSPLGKSTLAVKILKYLEKILYNQADRIVTVTPETTQMIQPLRNGTPVSMIRNGVDEHAFKPADTYSQSTQDPFVVGYVGSFASQHDLKTLLEAAHYCTDDQSIEFRIIGNGKREQEFRELLSTYPDANINWMGLRSHQQIPTLIRDFDVAVNPIIESEATRSSVTVKFYEYLACGVPIINSAKGAAEELGYHSGAVQTIEPGNPRLLADTIQELKENKSKLTNMRRAAREYFTSHREEYSRTYQADQLADILKTELLQ